MDGNQIDVRDTIVSIQVSDLSKSKEWYSKAFGKQPDLEPFPGNVEFKVGGAWVQVTKGNVRASSWSLEIEVGDLSKETERLKTAGLRSGEVKTIPGVITYFDIADPDGNQMRWFQVLTKDEKVTGTRS